MNTNEARIVRNQTKRLAKLSDKQLMENLDMLAYKERKATLDIIIHLVEMERRRAYLAQGYHSSFDYCTRRLGYSESAAARRIRAARCVRDFPEVYVMLCERRINLATVSLIAPILAEPNKDELLSSISGKTYRETETIVARYRGDSATVRERVTPVAVGGSKNIYRHAGGKILNAGNVSDESTGETRFKVEFGAGDDFMKKLEEVRALMSNAGGWAPGLEETFTKLIESYLDRHSPKRRRARREKRSKRRPENPKIARTRHIPARTRDDVFTRDDNQCTFVSEKGVRCTATRHLQIDHIRPYGRDGGHIPQNLRVLCARHNRLEAERVYGRSFMSAYISRRE